jgi:hypothetical protein
MIVPRYVLLISRLQDFPAVRLAHVSVVILWCDLGRTHMAIFFASQDYCHLVPSTGQGMLHYGWYFSNNWACSDQWWRHHRETALRGKYLSYLDSSSKSMAPLTTNPQLICVIIHCNTTKGLDQRMRSRICIVLPYLKLTLFTQMTSEQLYFCNMFYWGTDRWSGFRVVYTQACLCSRLILGLSFLLVQWPQYTTRDRVSSWVVLPTPWIMSHSVMARQANNLLWRTR